MSTLEIKERLGKNFRPFVLCLSDGRKIDVPSPDHIAVAKGGVAVVGDDDVIRTIDALHIVSIDEKFAAR
jgi:hypothetical protein